MANVIMDDGLNIVTQVTDTQIFTQKVGSDGTLYINTINSNNNGGDLPAGSYHFSRRNYSINGEIQKHW